MITAWDLCTNVLLTNLEAVAPTFSERLNGAGPFNISLDLTDHTVSEQTSVILGLDGIPFKVIFSDPDTEQIFFTGIARTQTMDPSSPLLPITGTMLTGYFDSVFAAKSYTTSTTPAKLLYNVIQDVQTLVPGAQVFVTPSYRMANPPPSFVPGYQLGQRIKVSQIMNDLTMGITAGYGGVDYYMSSSFQPVGGPKHLLNICAPRCGIDATQSGLVIDLTTAATWSYAVDNSASSNETVVVGSGTGASQPVSDVFSDVLVGGLGQPPRQQALYQYNRVTSQSHLDSIARGASEMFQNPVRVFTVTLPVDYASCQLGGFSIGDDVLVTSPAAGTPYFPHGLSQWWRIVAYQVTYPTEGTASVVLTLNTPPVF